jgi:hypothetical protein
MGLVKTDRNDPTTHTEQQRERRVPQVRFELRLMSQMAVLRQLSA